MSYIKCKSTRIVKKYLNNFTKNLFNPFWGAQGINRKLSLSKSPKIFSRYLEKAKIILTFVHIH